MMKINKAYTGIVLLMASLFLSASHPPDDFAAARRLLKECVKSLGEISVPAGKDVYYMSMTVKTDMRSRGTDSETKMEVYLSEKQMHYVSNVLVTYQDMKDAFAIIPQRKMILWTRGGRKADGKEKMAVLTNFQDTLLTLSKVVSYKKIVENGNELKLITLEPHRQAIDKFNVARLEYIVDEKSKKIKRSTIYFLPTEDIAMRSIVYHEINLKYKGANISKPAYEQIFSSEGKLQTKYKGYQLVDKRN
jgi:hypothetical protein